MNLEKIIQSGEVKKIETDILIHTRKSLHQAIQLVSAAPRNLLNHDPSDASSALIWNSNSIALTSLPMNGIEVSLAFSSFELIVSKGDQSIDCFSLKEKTTHEGLHWLKEQLSGLGFDATTIDLKLPYKIGPYNYDRALMPHEDGLMSFSLLFHCMDAALKQIAKTCEGTTDIRCWPHHFDLATLVVLEKDINDQISKSIGLGLSPGDEGIEEPYIYINTWPIIDYDILSTIELPWGKGKWNKEGWSGALLHYSEIATVSNPWDLILDFVIETEKILDKILRK